ncbi:calmodulin-like [Onthophagus taurus]|uniref:calmodulin-like n=1 Tax=Onthophagus taurus TaxID=166361 RepID=UPI0039BE00BD
MSQESETVEILYPCPLTPEERRDLYRAFILFDQDGDREVKTELMGLIMENLGQICSEEEIESCQNWVDPDGKGFFKFPEFLTLIESKMENTTSRNLLKNCLNVFEDNDLDFKDVGFLHANELKMYLTTIEDKLDEKEVIEMYRELEINDDEEIRIEEIIDVLTSSEYHNPYNKQTLNLPPFTTCKPIDSERECLSTSDITSPFFKMSGDETCNDVTTFDV